MSVFVKCILYNVFGTEMHILGLPILVKYKNYNAFWFDMLVVSGLALAAGPPARKHRSDCYEGSSCMGFI